MASKSFAPANISCIFRIYRHKNPRWMGSYGVGFTLNLGVVAEASRSNKNEIFFNGKKIKSDTQLHLELSPTTKILERLKSLNKKTFLVGFKAEVNLSDKGLVNSAYILLKSADADLIVANDVGKENVGFDVETNEVFVVDRKKNTRHIGLADKRIVADGILELIAQKLK